jgi:transposase
MSPDMNPIEHVWDFIGRKINQRNPKCQNIDELRTAILSYKSGNSSPKNGLGVLCEA